MRTLQTQRLRVRAMTTADAGFMLTLLNDPTWLRFIGDRGVHTVAEAERYIQQGPMAMVERHGFGFGIVELQDQAATPIGVCGLAQRDYLDHPDIGFAFLPAYRGQGYAYEAAAAVLQQARGELGLPRILATTRTDNLSSQQLLEKLGLRFERLIRHPDGDRDLRLYSVG